MKINVNYTPEMIKNLIKRDIEEKINTSVELREIDIKVRSKQNYRQNDWEVGELKCEIEVVIS